MSLQPAASDEPDVIDLTEEPDSPVLQVPRPQQHGRRHGHGHASSASFRAAAQSGARSSRPAAAAATAAVAASSGGSAAMAIDLTGDDDVLLANPNGRERYEGQRYRDLYQININNAAGRGSSGGGGGSGGGAGAGFGDARASVNVASRAASFINAFAFNGINGLAHLTSIALGTSPAAHRQRSAHRHHRSHARGHFHRAHNHVNSHPSLLRHGSGGGGAGGGGGGSGSGSEVLFNEFDLFGAGLNPLGDNLPDLNYQLNGGFFQDFLTPGELRAANRDALYTPPQEALPGYTRNTAEDLVAVCAGCDAELAYDPDEHMPGAGGAEPPPKRTRSRKDREEHNFWAVTTCGHVYCRACYENRRSSLKKEAKEGGQTNGGPSFVVEGRSLLCAVEGCRADVTAKKNWVGLFV